MAAGTRLGPAHRTAGAAVAPHCEPGARWWPRLLVVGGSAAGAATVTDWRELASCRGKPTSLWYSFDPLEVSIACAVCRSCPVRSECRAEGMDEPGVWGGVTAEQRTQLGQHVA